MQVCPLALVAAAVAAVIAAVIAALAAAAASARSSVHASFRHFYYVASLGAHALKNRTGCV